MRAAGLTGTPARGVLRGAGRIGAICALGTSLVAGAVPASTFTVAQGARASAVDGPGPLRLAQSSSGTDVPAAGAGSQPAREPPREPAKKPPPDAAAGKGADDDALRKEHEKARRQVEEMRKLNRAAPKI